MPYTTLVAGTTITASWANANVRDQVVTPFSTAAARSSAVTSPIAGMLTYRADAGSQDGGDWEGYANSKWVGLRKPPHCTLTRVTNLSIANDTISPYPLITWTAEESDNDGMVNLGTSDSTVNIVSPGDYLFALNVRWEGNVTGARELLIDWNGTVEQIDGRKAVDSGGAQTTHSGVFGAKFAGGDTVKFRAWQNSGVGLNINRARMACFYQSGD